MLKETRYATLVGHSIRWAVDNEVARPQGAELKRIVMDLVRKGRVCCPPDICG